MTLNVHSKIYSFKASSALTPNLMNAQAVYEIDKRFPFRYMCVFAQLWRETAGLRSIEDT